MKQLLSQQLNRDDFVTLWSRTWGATECVTDGLPVFCCVLWGTTGQTYSNMESGFFYKTKKENVVSDDVVYASVLTLYTLTSVCIFSILFSIHFLRGWQGEFVYQSREYLVRDHLLYSHDLTVWCRGYTVGRNYMSHSQGLKGQDSSLSHNEQKGFMLSCVCPIVNQKGCQNMVGTTEWHMKFSHAYQWFFRCYIYNINIINARCA